jgi:hypothetical protein
VRRPRSREVLAAFAAHKDEVTAGYAKAAKRGRPVSAYAHGLYLAPLGTFESQQGSAVEEARRYLVRRAPPWGLEACALHPFVTDNDQSQRRVFRTEPSSRRMVIVRHPRSYDRSL